VLLFCVAPSLEDPGPWDVWGAPSRMREPHITLRMWDAETDQVMASPFVGPVGVVDVHRNLGGWAMCLDLAGCDSSDSRHLFWVPQTCREAICGKETLAVFSKHATRLDLSQFVHGTSWTRCYDPHSSAPAHPFYSPSSADNISSRSPQYSSPADNPILSRLPTSKESPRFEPNNCPPPSEASPPGSFPISATDHCNNPAKQASDCPPPTSVPSYAHYFQCVVIILIPLISIYYSLTISSSK